MLLPVDVPISQGASLHEDMHVTVKTYACCDLMHCIVVHALTLRILRQLSLENPDLRFTSHLSIPHKMGFGLSILSAS